MNISVEIFLFLASILIIISLLVGKMGSRFGVPTLLLFLIIGMLFGSDGLGIEFHNPLIAQVIGVVALNIILFSGGLDTRFEEVKPVMAKGFILATVGVFLTAALTGLFIFWLTNNYFKSITFSWVEAFLLASVMSSTDSASVFSILRSKNLSLKENLRPTLEFESGSNDPMAYMLTIVMLHLLQDPNFSTWSAVVFFLQQLIFGGLVGFFLGKLSVAFINKINLANDALYSVLLIALMFLLFGFTSFIGGNGYLAVYVGGLYIGNSKFVHKRSSLKFFDGLTWLVQIIMFLALGLLVNPSDMIPYVGIGVIIGLFLIFLARPISIWISLLPFRDLSGKACSYISWVGLRGAVPIIFATYPLIQGEMNADTIFNIVFFITILSLLIQGTTVSAMADWLNLSLLVPKKQILQNFDVEFSEDIKSFMTEITINEEYLKFGNRLMDMKVPDKTLIVMVKRNELYFIPRGNTKLIAGDKILVITDDEKALEETYRLMKGEKE